MWSRDKKDKSLLEKGSDFVSRVVYDEKDNVTTFLSKSIHYKALLEAKIASEDSKQGKKGYTPFKSMYELHASEEQEIAAFANAETFADLYEKTNIPITMLSNSYAEPILSIAGSLWQKANAGCHMFRFAKEIKEFAEANAYSLEPKKQLTSSYK